MNGSYAKSLLIQIAFYGFLVTLSSLIITMYKNLPGYEGRLLYCMEGLMFDTLTTHATCISITFPFSSTCTHNTGAMATYMKYVKGSIIYKVRAWHRPELWHDRVLDMKLYLLSWMRISITPPPHSLSPSPSCSPFLHPLSFIPRSLSHTSRPPLSLYLFLPPSTSHSLSPFFPRFLSPFHPGRGYLLSHWHAPSMLWSVEMCSLRMW